MDRRCAESDRRDKGKGAEEREQGHGRTGPFTVGACLKVGAVRSNWWRQTHGRSPLGSPAHQIAGRPVHKTTLKIAITALSHRPKAVENSRPHQRPRILFVPPNCDQYTSCWNRPFFLSSATKAM